VLISGVRNYSNIVRIIILLLLLVKLITTPPVLAAAATISPASIARKSGIKV
jgi:hypothetical protein